MRMPTMNPRSAKHQRPKSRSIVIPILLFSLSLGFMGLACALALGMRSGWMILPFIGAALPAASLRWRAVVQPIQRVAGAPVPSEDAEPSHPMWARISVPAMLMLAAALLLAFSLRAAPGGGWWLAGAFLPIAGACAYAGRQWCGAKTYGRVFLGSVAGFCIGVAGNLAASEADRARCNAQAEAALGDAFAPLIAKLDQLLAGQERIAADLEKMLKMGEQLLDQKLHAEERESLRK